MHEDDNTLPGRGFLTESDGKPSATRITTMMFAGAAISLAFIMSLRDGSRDMFDVILVFTSAAGGMLPLTKMLNKR